MPAIVNELVNTVFVAVSALPIILVGIVCLLALLGLLRVLGGK